MSSKPVTSVSERVNFAPSLLDEKNLLEIQNTQEVGVSEAIRNSMHLYADILRLGLMEQILMNVSEAKTVKLIELEAENRELRG